MADTGLLVKMSGRLYSRTPLIGDVTGRFFSVAALLAWCGPFFPTCAIPVRKCSARTRKGGLCGVVHNLLNFFPLASGGLKEQTETVSHFVVIQYQNGRLEILPLANDCDPVQMARERGAFLVGITASRSRAEFILSRERLMQVRS